MAVSAWANHYDPSVRLSNSCAVGDVLLSMIGLSDGQAANDQYLTSQLAGQALSSFVTFKNAGTEV